MFPLIGTLASSALNILSGLQSQASNTKTDAGAFLSQMGLSSGPPQPPGTTTGQSAGYSPLSPSVLAFLIQNQGAQGQGATTSASTASSQAAALSASSDSSVGSFRSDFSQLKTALNNGDLAGAQQAYATLSQLMGGQASSSSSPSDPFSQALNQIGQDLQSGNLTGAQQTMALLLQQLQAGQGSHHHRRHDASASDPTAASAADPTSLTPGDRSADGASSSTSANANGSTTTTLTYADGSTITMTTAAASTTPSSPNSSGVQPATSTSNTLETLIRLQAQLLGPVAGTA